MVPTLVQVFTNSIVTGSCSVTEFMRLVGVPAPFVKGARFRRISINHLYEAYKLFFTKQSEDQGSEDKIVPRTKFKRIVEFNGYKVKRVSYCRGEIQGIKLNILQLKNIFEKGARGNFEEWLHKSVGVNSATYML